MTPTGTLTKQLRRFLDATEGAGDLTTAQRSFVAGELALFCERAANKFIKGQREHGGNFPFDTTRSFLGELDGELIDFFFYSRGLREKLKSV